MSDTLEKIEVNMNVYDIPIVVEALEKANKEIERLNKQIEEYQKALDETTSEKIDLENIIKEDKKIEKLIEPIASEYIYDYAKKICNKINEIIDHINGSDK